MADNIPRITPAYKVSLVHRNLHSSGVRKRSVRMVITPRMSIKTETNIKG